MDATQTTPVQWTLPRPPAYRYCTLTIRSPNWPDKGCGIWMTQGVENLDLPDETFILVRIAPAALGGPSGETIRVERHYHERGYLRVWLKDPEDQSLNAQGA